MRIIIIWTGAGREEAMIKTITFGAMHISIAFLVVWTMTGSWMVGGAVALVEPVINTVAYFFHEKAWSRWSRRQEEGFVVRA